MNIGKKLILGFCSIALLTAFLGAVSALSLRNLSRQIDREIPQGINDQASTARLDSLARDVRYYDERLTQSARNYAFTGNKKWAERYEGAARELNVLIKNVIKRGDAEDAKIFLRIDTANHALMDLEHKAIKATADGNAGAAINILESNEYASYKTTYSQGLQDFALIKNRKQEEAIQSSGKAVGALSRRTHDLVQSRIKQVLMVAAILVTILIGISWLISRSIERPIKALQKGIEIVGTGNLNYRVGTAAKDEIAQLSRSFDAMVVHLQELTVSRDRLNQELAERRQAVEALRRSEARFKAIYENSFDAMALMADDGFLECNRRAVEMFGVASKDEFFKLKPEDISPPTQPNGQKSSFLATAHAQWAVQNGRDQFEWIHRRANGEDFPAEVSFSAFDIQGRRVLHSTVHDITERRKMEDSLREREETFRAITESASDAIILMDSVGTITFWNSAAEKIFNYSSKEALGRNLHQLISPSRFRETQFRSMIHSGKSVEGTPAHRMLELAALRKDGGEFPTEVYIIPLYLRGRRHAVSIIRDISERKRIEEEMRQAREEAEAANRMKSAFLANMSHEIRTPMNGILGMASLLLDTEMSLKQRDFAETLQRSAESLLTIINDILDYSKVEAGRLELEQIDFHLRHCVEDVADLLALRAQEKGLEFICMLDADLPDYVCGDPGRFRQVLTNLAGNAVKFTERGEVSLHISLAPGSGDDVSLRCEVRDTGIGIKPADQKRLFQPFTQVDASTARRFGGTGLGLSITRQLVERMGGSIEMESEIGRGSIFRFTLALGRAKTTPFLSAPIGELAGRRVLVVDDNETNRRLLQSLLTKWECHCELASDASSAMEKMQAANCSGQPFDVALLDMHMPGISGEELGRRIKQDETLKETRLVMITSFGERGDAQRLMQIGFAGYLSKPVRQEQLRRCMETVLGFSGAGSAIDRPLVTSHILAEQCQGTRRVLVVEDNFINQKVARGMIEKLGFFVEIASNGQEALDALRNRPFDLVFMDCQMPEMDGFEATARLRDPACRVRNPNVPVIAMTANAMKGDREKCLEAGMDDYVSKPVNPPDLAAAIERWLDRLHKAPTADPTASAMSVPANALPPVSDQADFNRVDLLERLSGDEELAMEVVSSFITEMQGQLAALGKALAGADVGEAQRLAHSMKGASGSVACSRLQDLAQCAESACREGRLHDARATGAELCTAFSLAENAFRIAGFLPAEALQ